MLFFKVPRRCQLNFKTYFRKLFKFQQKYISKKNYKYVNMIEELYIKIIDHQNDLFKKNLYQSNDVLSVPGDAS